MVITDPKRRSPMNLDALVSDARGRERRGRAGSLALSLRRLELRKYKGTVGALLRLIVVGLLVIVTSGIPTAASAEKDECGESDDCSEGACMAFCGTCPSGGATAPATHSNLASNGRGRVLLVPSWECSTEPPTIVLEAVFRPPRA